jgi:DUF4097 and DUF4098 domain-containing protein YvlB
MNSDSIEHTYDLEVHTTGGHIDVGASAKSMFLETTSGHITFAGGLVTGSNNELITFTGNIKVDLDDNPSVKDLPSVEIDAITLVGNISSQLPMRVLSADNDHLHAIVGEGDAKLNLRTSSGTIDIE